MTRPLRAPDVQVLFRLTPFSEDGRKKMVRSGCRPIYVVRPDYWSSAHHEFVEASEVNTGEQARADVWLLTPEAYPASFWRGRIVLVTEGSIVVGVATVLDIFNPLLDVPMPNSRFNTYIDVAWVHHFPSEPVRLVSELDSEGRELRKLEFFRDGLVGFADRESEVRGTRLSETPLPSVAQINEDSQFIARNTSAEQFESLWQEHAS